MTVATVLRAIMEREQLTIRHLTGLMADMGATVLPWDCDTVPEMPVTYIGLERPEGLHPDSRIITPENLRDLIPD